MMFSSLLAVVGLLMAVVLADTIEYCGTQPYYSSQYTCYDGFLCPVIEGEATLKCDNACYLKEAYICSNGQLAQHPLETHAFNMVARNSISGINGKQVTACGNYYYVGDGDTCSYCPMGLGSICSEVANTTIVLPNGSPDVIVPGGLQSYIEPNGAYGFTEAHSISYPVNSTLDGFAAFENGYFVYTAAPNWLACPAAGQPGNYQIFAKLEGVTFNGSCVSLNIVTQDVPDGTLGAWQYT